MTLLAMTSAAEKIAQKAGLDVGDGGDTYNIYVNQSNATAAETIGEAFFEARRTRMAGAS